MPSFQQQAQNRSDALGRAFGAYRAAGPLGGNLAYGMVAQAGANQDAVRRMFRQEQAADQNMARMRQLNDARMAFERTQQLAEDQFGFDRAIQGDALRAAIAQQNLQNQGAIGVAQTTGSYDLAGQRAAAQAAIREAMIGAGASRDIAGIQSRGAQAVEGLRGQNALNLGRLEGDYGLRGIDAQGENQRAAIEAAFRGDRSLAELSGEQALAQLAASGTTEQKLAILRNLGMTDTARIQSRGDILGEAMRGDTARDVAGISNQGALDQIKSQGFVDRMLQQLGDAAKERMLSKTLSSQEGMSSEQVRSQLVQAIMGDRTQRREIDARRDVGMAGTAVEQGELDLARQAFEGDAPPSVKTWLEAQSTRAANLGAMLQAAESAALQATTPEARAMAQSRADTLSSELDLVNRGMGTVMHRFLPEQAVEQEPSPSPSDSILSRPELLRAIQGFGTSGDARQTRRQEGANTGEITPPTKRRNPLGPGATVDKLQELYDLLRYR